MTFREQISQKLKELIDHNGKILFGHGFYLEKSMYNYVNDELSLDELEEFITKKVYKETFLIVVDGFCYEIIYKKVKGKLKFYFILKGKEFYIKYKLTKENKHKICDEIRKRIKKFEEKNKVETRAENLQKVFEKAVCKELNDETKNIDPKGEG